MKTSQLVQKYLNNALENNADIEQIKTLFEIYQYFYDKENDMYFIPSVWSNDVYTTPCTKWTVTSTGTGKDDIRAYTDL